MSFAAALLAAARANPIAAIAWLPLQLRYLRSRSNRRLLRAGNQSLGKTTVALADLYLSAIGEHPYRTNKTTPGEYWVICASWSQSIAIQGKLHALIAPMRLHAETAFDDMHGFRAKNPAVRVLHKNGGYSIIRFRTTQQGTLDLAGATIDGALFDEVPSSEAIYSEVCKRTQARGGWVAIAMTPIGAPVDWVRREAEDGRLEDIWAPLSEEGLIPEGATEPRWLPSGEQCTADWIASVEAATPPHEVPVRVHGAWEIRIATRYFATFRSTGPNPHVHDNTPDGDVRLYLGIDHGDRPGKQIALLCALWGNVGGTPSVYVLDEYSDDVGTANPADDARGILAMLQRNDFAWSDLEGAYGDRIHMPGMGGQKSNKDLFAQVARELGKTSGQVYPIIKTVKRGTGRGPGSVEVGLRWIFHAITANRLHIHPRCKRLIDALDKFVGPVAANHDEREGHKDPVDALRYALDPFIFAKMQTAGTSTVVVR